MTFSDEMGWERKPEYICEMNSAEPYYESIYAVRDPVVRCKDCKHHNEHKCFAHFSEGVEEAIIFPAPDNFFCAWGKRVEGSEE